MNKKMPTIALVDDYRNNLTSVGMAMEAEGYSVQQYNDGAAALQGLLDNPPDMPIFDIKMPRMDGMELLRRIRQKTDLPVIFLTSKDDEIDELFGLKMGADDFIKKPFSQRLLVERVKAVLRRSAARDSTAQPTEAAKVIERGKLSMDTDRHSCTWEGKPVVLTVTEFLILQSLAQRPGIVKSRDALMDAAYDSEIIREHSRSLGHVALIDFNHRSPNDTREFSPHEAQRYKERSTAERVNARLKDEFGARMIFVRGPQKIMAHLAFGLIALTVDQLIRFVT